MSGPADARSPKVVAIINSSDDTIEMLRVFLEGAGFVVVSGHVADVRRGELDLERFFERHAPDLVLYDVSPPYEQAFNFFQHLRKGALRGRKVLLTTTNRVALEQLVGVTDAHEIIGKPYDLNVVLERIRRDTGTAD